MKNEISNTKDTKDKNPPVDNSHYEKQEDRKPGRATLSQMGWLWRSTAVQMFTVKSEQKKF